MWGYDEDLIDCGFVGDTVFTVCIARWALKMIRLAVLVIEMEVMIKFLHLIVMVIHRF